MPKMIQSSDVPTLFRPDTTVYVHGMCSEPLEIMTAVQAAPEASRGVTYVKMFAPGTNKLDYCAFHPEARAITFFISPELRDSWKAGKVDFYPFHVSQNYRFLAEMNPVDMLILHLSPPDSEGNCTLGLTTDYIPAILDDAKLLVAEINPHMPHTFGGPRIPYDRLDYVVEVDYTPVEFPPSKVTETFSAIGRNVVEQIHDGDCIQIGIGNAASAILRALKDHRELGFHSGMITDAAAELIQSGAMTGARKNIDTGRHVACLGMGTKSLFDFMRDNPTVQIREVSHTHGADVLGGMENLVTLNSTLTLDLFGQGNSESRGIEQHGCVGGQVDFVRGARRSEGGRGIMALAATAKGGTVSRIVPTLPQGAIVSTTRADMDYVATEYGVACLRNMHVDERATALIGLAAPQFRDELQNAWDRMRAAM